MDTGIQKATENIFVGESNFAKNLTQVLRAMAVVPDPVLITGETGTGKSVLAKMINQYRGQARLVKVPCPNIPENLFESELFGANRGSYTGMIGNKEGLLTGEPHQTVWFDEFAETEEGFQRKLLTLLDGDFRRIGGKNLDCFQSKVVASTNVDPKTAIRNGRLRGDLLARLQILHIHIPPLRERRKDVLPLIHYFLKQRRPTSVLEERERSAKQLENHSWLANTREILSVVARTDIGLQSDTVTTDDIMEHLDARGDVQVSNTNWDTSLESPMFPDGISNLDDLETALLKKSLILTGGNKSEAARRLGISRNALRYRLNARGLEQ